MAEILRLKVTYLISKLNKKAYMSFSPLPRIDEKTRYAEIYLKMEGSIQAQFSVFCIDANDNLKYGIRDYYPETFVGKGSGPALYDYFDTYEELVKEWNERVKKLNNKDNLIRIKSLKEELERIEKTINGLP
jgi:hypothetical protein